MLIEHIDPDGRTWDIPYFESDNIETLLAEKQYEVHSAILNSLIQLAKEGIDQVPSFSVNELVFEVNRETALDNLEKCLDYYEITEQFEKCSEIVKLKDKLCENL